MIDTQNEQLLSFTAAARSLPHLRGDRPVSPATIWRWTSRGVRARSGTSVRLEFVKIGGATVTSKEALARFFARLTDTETDGTSQQMPTNVKAHARAEANLDRASI